MIAQREFHPRKEPRTTCLQPGGKGKHRRQFTNEKKRYIYGMEGWGGKLSYEWCLTGMKITHVCSVILTYLTTFGI